VALTLALALIATCAALVLAGGGAAAAPGAPGKPNIIVLYTDDQEPSSIRVMKILRKEMKAKGVTMKRYYTNFPLCCPSRATMLTGQYAHNHGVLSNQPPDGGFGVFDAKHAGNSVNDWLQTAGYTTAYIGKFLNGYAQPDLNGNLPTYVPPGWDDWRVLAPSSAQYFDYTLNQNGTRADFGEEDDQYSTDKFTIKAKRYIRRSAPDANPFFLMLGYAAPHGGGGGAPGRSCNRGARPAPRHVGALRKRAVKYGFPPSFNEDTSDKPSPLATQAPLSERQIADIRRKRRCAWESLLAVDESVGAILEELKRSGERRNTYVFFTSDNGLLRGEHRVRNQKRYLYEASARVPFVVRGPGVARGESSSDVVTNADLVPTILDISGAEPGRVQDGESLLGTFASPKTENGRAILLEAYGGPPIIGLRTSRYLYTEWDTGGVLPERELYDTYADPYQLNNLLLANNLTTDPVYGPAVARLSAQLEQMIECQGSSCLGRPTAQLSISSGGTGKDGCVLEPLVARVDSPQRDEIESVEFRLEGRLLLSDYEAPYEAPIPYAPLRKALPESAIVLAKALFEDGRRVAQPAQVKACR
jgi:arylsulfatase A-like enzyme